MSPVRSFRAVAAIAVTALGSAAGAEPFTLGGDPRVDPDRFRVTTFATGLNFPYAMAELPDGSLLVGTGSAGSYFNTTGQLIRLADHDRDGVADAQQTLYSGFSGGVTEVSILGDLVITTSSQAGGGAERISFLRMGDSLDDPLTFLDAMSFTIPRPWLHTTFAHAVRPAPDESGDYELYFNLGSRTNATLTTDTATTTGLLSATLNGDSIYRVTLRDDGEDVTLSNPVQIATGLRNAAGIEFHPETGDLYFEDNGIDGLVNPNEPHSADELNVIPAAQLGATVLDFGFPDSYIEYRTGNVIGGQGIQPLVAIQPIPDPITGDEAEGPAQIAFAPPHFPAGMNSGVFIGMHGKFSQGGLANEENALVFIDLDTLEYFHFIGVDEPAVGHLDGLLATSDSLFLADLSPPGPLTGTNTGIIYQIRAIPLTGDMNGDGVLDAFDVAPFELALADLAAYQAAYPGLDPLERGDITGDGALDAFDVAPFEALLAGVPTPEPGAAMLLGIGAMMLMGKRRRQGPGAMPGAMPTPARFARGEPSRSVGM